MPEELSPKLTAVAHELVERMHDLLDFSVHGAARELLLRNVVRLAEHKLREQREEVSLASREQCIDWIVTHLFGADFTRWRYEQVRVSVFGVDGEHRGRLFGYRTPWSIGSGTDTILVMEPEVAAHHSVITCSDGTVRVVTVGVDDRPADLEPGDRIHVGTCTFVVNSIDSSFETDEMGWWY